MTIFLHTLQMILIFFVLYKKKLFEKKKRWLGPPEAPPLGPGRLWIEFP